MDAALKYSLIAVNMIQSMFCFLVFLSKGNERINKGKEWIVYSLKQTLQPNHPQIYYEYLVTLGD